MTSRTTGVWLVTSVATIVVAIAHERHGNTPEVVAPELLVATRERRCNDVINSIEHQRMVTLQ